MLRLETEAEKPKEFDKAFLTYKGYRWPRDMFQFIVQDIGVPRDKISHVGAYVLPWVHFPRHGVFAVHRHLEDTSAEVLGT